MSVDVNNDDSLVLLEGRHEYGDKTTANHIVNLPLVAGQFAHIRGGNSGAERRVSRTLHLLVIHPFLCPFYSCDVIGRNRRSIFFIFIDTADRLQYAPEIIVRTEYVAVRSRIGHILLLIQFLNDSECFICLKPHLARLNLCACKHEQFGRVRRHEPLFTGLHNALVSEFLYYVLSIFFVFKPYDAGFGVIGVVIS